MDENVRRANKVSLFEKNSIKFVDIARDLARHVCVVRFLTARWRVGTDGTGL